MGTEIPDCPSAERILKRASAAMGGQGCELLFEVAGVQRRFLLWFEEDRGISCLRSSPHFETWAGPYLSLPYVVSLLEWIRFTYELGVRAVWYEDDASDCRMRIERGGRSSEHYFSSRRLPPTMYGPQRGDLDQASLASIYWVVTTFVQAREKLCFGLEGPGYTADHLRYIGPWSYHPWLVRAYEGRLAAERRGLPLIRKGVWVYAVPSEGVFVNPMAAGASGPSCCLLPGACDAQALEGVLKAGLELSLSAEPATADTDPIRKALGVSDFDGVMERARRAAVIESNGVFVLWRWAPSADEPGGRFGPGAPAKGERFRSAAALAEAIIGYFRSK